MRRATNYMAFHSTRVPILFKTRNHSYPNLHILPQTIQIKPTAHTKSTTTGSHVRSPSGVIRRPNHVASGTVQYWNEQVSDCPSPTASAWLRLAGHCTCEPALYEWHAGGPGIIAGISCMECSSRCLPTFRGLNFGYITHATSQQTH
jgi:hypothetical protein